MKLSAPLHILKSRAKALKKERSLKLSEALDEIAKREGYDSWSLLQSKAGDLFPKRKEDVLQYLNPGDLMLIGSRPGLGKTTFTLEILLQAITEKRNCYFFSLEYTHRDVAEKLANLDESIGQHNPHLSFDFSDDISSDYIIEKVSAEIKENSIIAVDYLQILDQKRSKPELQKQIEELKNFARKTNCIIIFISQLDRSFEEKKNVRPSLDDIRLPNPIDLNLFNKSLFLHNGKMVFTSPRSFELD